MVESKHAASEASRAQKLELELESSQTLLENTRIALDRTQEHERARHVAAFPRTILLENGPRSPPG